MIAAAFQEAAAHGVTVRILHACRHSTAASAASGGPEAEARLAIDTIVTREQRRHPKVHVSVYVSDTDAADLLNGSTNRASLLVVGHRPYEGRLPPQEHLTRSILRHSAAGVLSVPVGADRPHLQPTS